MKPQPIRPPSLSRPQSWLWPSAETSDLIYEEFADRDGVRGTHGKIALFVYGFGMVIALGYTLFNHYRGTQDWHMVAGIALFLVNAVGMLAHLAHLPTKPERYPLFFSIYAVQLINVYQFGVGPFLILPMVFACIYMLSSNKNALRMCLSMLVAGIWCLLASSDFRPSELDIRGILLAVYAFVAIHVFSAFSTYTLHQIILSRRQAQEFEQRKQYISLATHELRTPLAQLRQVLFSSDLNAVRPQLHGVLDQGLDHLNWVLSRVVDYQALKDNGSLPSKPATVVPVDWTESLMNHVRSEAGRAQVELQSIVDSDIPPRLTFEVDWVGRAVRCLLENAVEHNQAGGFVRCHLKCVAESALRIEVSDSAGGLDASSLDGVFQAFNTADQLGDTTQWKGLGLGLFMAQQYMIAAGGELRLQSTGVDGTVFELDVPMEFDKLSKTPTSKKTIHEPLKAEDVRAKRASGLPVALAPNENCSVLVVDDSELVLQSTRDLLTTAGFRVGLAASGAEALSEMARSMQNQTPYDLLLMDLQMPGMDGFTCVKALRAEWGEHCPPVVAYTASSYTEVSDEVVDAQFDGFYRKGDNIQALIDLLMHLLMVQSGPISSRVG